MKTTIFGDTISSLKKESINAVSVFQKTLTKLEEANKKVRFKRAEREESRAKINDQIDELNSLEKQNINFMNKINSIFKE